ncbi:hypothetical protein SCHPADRAFT_935375 [Schizopora paradoxa]|uniref:Pre-mRNA-splicing factor CWC26 n=1 Tax=Schizopora paradoxa TaxID=27342 RepID=A0A0H2SQD2_9AGAM|nr:hypothetical protein SCHPADRAFT_935375 [Schizopora paradoxa]
MQAYLAEKYMSGPKADAILARTSHKKKKRKVDPSSSSSVGLSLVDNDGGWGNVVDEEEDELKDAAVADDRSFKKRKDAKEGSGWTTIREGKRPPTPPPEDEEPQIVEDNAEPVGGILNAKQLKKVLGKGEVIRKPQTEEEIEAARQAQETVYRDATGRRIDTKAERAEAARKKREKEEAEAKKMEWGKGLVQIGEADRRKAELEKERRRGLAVYADDKDLNNELKAQERWNDPAAAFLSKKTSKGPRKPEYTGPPPPPNRFGIKPGYRWDGVDRGNGFEKKLFQKVNERKRRGQESYNWSVDEM